MTMTQKKQFLESAGYRYSFERRLYINRLERKAFSVEFIDDSTEDRLREALDTPAPSSGNWDFKFNTAPSPSVKLQLEALLG